MFIFSISFDGEETIATRERLLDPLIQLPGSSQPMAAPSHRLGAGAVAAIVIGVMCSAVILIG